jgi:uncharacterized protein (DUF433 family)
MRPITSTTKPRQARRRRIVRVPGICGGRAIVAGTRMPVWGLEVARRHGRSDEQILAMYPAVTRSDLVAAWRWVRRHKPEIERDIAEVDHQNFVLPKPRQARMSSCHRREPVGQWPS